jgi:phosphatidylethanolamine/phosphatidyl-N-methylethanolamine N-methyltransferase
MTTPSKDNVIRTYRFYAPFYDWLFGATLEPGRRALMKRISALQPSTVLEIGVGTGLTLHRYPATAAVTGIDISEEMLDIARRRAKKLARLETRLFSMDAEKIDFPDGSFDCVVVPYVLSVTPNPEKLVKEIRRVCSAGGRILILNHFSGSRFWWILERAVRSLANKIGFRSDFSYQEHILKYDWTVKSITEVNFLGLSKLVEIQNA